jgi:outer membrane lipoprotein-sorting protein
MRSKFHSVALALLALLSLCAACSNPPGGAGGANSGPSTAGGANSGASTAGGGATAVSPDQNPQDMLTKSMQAQLNAKSLRASMTNTSSQGTYTATLEYASPDRYRMVSPQGEMIAVGNDAYMKAGGRWVKSPVNVGQLINQFRDPKVVEEMRRTTDIKYVGTDMLDGQSMFVYEYALNEATAKGAKSRAKTWISPADMLPRKTEVDGEVGGIKSHTTITYSDYNSDIKIEPPM